ncbi:unnamed protein product [Trichobilharzia regenti]|nr:unnamed protein product [Trichobilharzia regenti]
MPTSMFRFMSSSHTKSTVSISGTLVNKEDTSNDIMNLLLTFKSFIPSTNPPTQYVEATGWYGEFNISNTDRSRTPLLCILGEPYNLDGNVPVGFTDLY